MALFKCKMCGGDLEIVAGTPVAECEFCGTKQTLPKTNDEGIQNLFCRANNLRIKCEFDKAEQIYEKILQMDDTEAEAHWGMVLCKYGIEYVEDPKTFRRIPTCHRASYDAVTADPEYQAAIRYADPAQKSIYEADAKNIEQIQKDILSVVKNEKPFDVFICYKETDEEGKRTIDSAIANDIYHQLTQEGLKVFYAAITLEDKLGQAYEPYIFAALNSARVMLVIGTKPQYFSAVWVKNEWSRYLKLMKNDRSKLLIPCYRDMDAYDLPEEFSHLQAQDMMKIGFINDVVRGIRKVVKPQDTKAPAAAETPVTTANANTAPLLERAFMFLEDGDWTSANEYCEKVLDIDPKNAKAYLGKLMADIRCRKQEKLKDQAEPFDTNGNYQKVLRFADDTLKTELTGTVEFIKERNENARQEGIYQKALSAMNVASTEKQYSEAAKEFEALRDYKEAAEKAKECRKKAEIERKDLLLATGIGLMNRRDASVSDLESAIEKFKQIRGWKDADGKIKECREKIERLKAQAEEDRRKKEQAKIEAQEAATRAAKKKKTIKIISLAAICVVIAFIILLKNVIIPNGKYNDAIALMEAGKTVEAYEALIAMNGYKDSAEKAKSIYEQYKVEKLKVAKAGDYVYFGTYEQDNNTANGKEDVQWLVLEVRDGKALVISKNALDCKKYNDSHENVTWETCDLRQWLNGEFISAAFTAEEKAMIPTVTVTADKNPEYDTDPGNDTQDQVFLLSIAEANQYFSSDEERKCQATDYADANGAYTNSDGSCWWWLRSPGGSQRSASGVYGDGFVGVSGHGVDDSGNAVRPALWINLNS